ncbi:kinetochore Sim4 complex subunit Fta4 [Xylaria nigripes]|nr:kinetochore Sim4 complex subunit Fta4 [Xylaria nigripes]
MAPPTIIAHKSTFITSQSLHLSQSLAPSSTWRQANEAAEDGLSARSVDDALYRLNHILAQHARRVYAPQASRHVAEQIEGLFHEEAARALRGDYGDDENERDGGGEDLLDGERRRLRLGADFTSAETIASLPPTWTTQNAREAAEQPLEAERYATLTTNLKSLSEKRQDLLDRVNRLKRISALLAPFSAPSDPSKPSPDVQENLVTRNGELERELERMRLLLARVSGRVAQLPGKKRKGVELGALDDGGEGTDIEAIERAKVEKLINSL